MNSRRIVYIWKVGRPKNEAIAKALILAAFKTAIQTDSKPTQVLIRSIIHPSTRTSSGRYVKDRPHITISVKNAKTESENKHITSHGYTSTVESFDVIQVVPKGHIKSDLIGDAWPANMATRPKDIMDGETVVLGPKEDFISYPLEETEE